MRYDLKQDMIYDIKWVMRYDIKWDMTYVIKWDMIYDIKWVMGYDIIMSLNEIWHMTLNEIWDMTLNDPSFYVSVWEKKENGYRSAKGRVNVSFIFCFQIYPKYWMLLLVMKELCHLYCREH